MNTGYFRVAAAVPSVNVADVEHNVESIVKMCKELDDKGVMLAVFPELSVTGYTCADLFHQERLIEAAVAGIDRLQEFSNTLNLVFIVGAPVRHNGALYNCAIAIGGGEILAIVPKTYLPNYNEFYEKRWFTPANSEG